MRLPADVRQPLERVFRANLGGVRVARTRALPPHVAAVTRGSTIAFAAGVWQPDSIRCRAMLAHEIAHAFQQQRLGLTGDALLVDTRLEAEADAWACLALLHPVLLEAFPERPVARLAARPNGVAQPWILMARDTGDDPQRYGTEKYKPELTFNGYFNKPDVNRGKPIDDRFVKLQNLSTAAQAVAAAYRFLFSRDPDRSVLLILFEWMGASKRAEMRYYHTFGELAWAIEQERESRAALRQEDAVAQMVMDSPKVRALLRSLAEKVALLIEQNQERLPLDEKAAYGPLHGSETFGDVYLTLQSAASVLSSNRIIALLHDAKDVCAKGGLFDTSEPAFDLHLGENKKLSISKSSMRYNVGTVDEADPWTLWMRENKRAVWAGPSYTMLHMWTMAKTAGASKAEMGAMAFAMFAYWNRDYPHSATPVHRFHETFAAAHKFELTYHPSLGVLANWSIFALEGSSKL